MVFLNGLALEERSEWLQLLLEMVQRWCLFTLLTCLKSSLFSRVDVAFACLYRMVMWSVHIVCTCAVRMTGDPGDLYLLQNRSQPVHM